MGFDIYALDDSGREIAYLRAHMGTFRMLIEQGYDWFELIDASECNGGVSGTGEKKRIKVTDIRRAMEALLSHDTRGELASIDPLQSRKIGKLLQRIMHQKPDPADMKDNFVDAFQEFSPDLQRFMEECLEWCEAENRDSIEILFT